MFKLLFVVKRKKEENMYRFFLYKYYFRRAFGDFCEGVCWKIIHDIILKLNAF